MNWKKEAVNLLKDYPARKESLHNIKERYTMLEKEMSKLRSAENEHIPVRGALSRTQEQLFNTMTEKEQLQFNYHMVRQQLDWVDRGLASLNEEERIVLEGFFLASAEHSKDDLMDKLCVERSTLYDMREKALRKFTISMYGLLES